MGLRVSFELDDEDLKHFELVMREARRTAARLAPEDIIAAAETLFSKLTAEEAPGFIITRLQKLRLMIRMISDVDWRLPHEDASRILNALAYFTEPDDLIPDDIPGLGFLDDAIMVELVVRELQHEVDAYRDFCNFRQTALEEDSGRAVSREAWLDSCRDELQSRMRRRRKSMLKSRGKRLSLFD